MTLIVITLIVSLSLLALYRTRKISKGMLEVLAAIAAIVAVLWGFLTYVIPPSLPGGGAIYVSASPTLGESSPTSTIESVVPTPTSIPTEFLEEIRRDDFSSSASEWDGYATTEGNANYEGNKYFVEPTDDLMFLAIWRGAGLKDNGVFRVDALGPFENESRQGLGFGYRDTWDGTYAFTVDSLGKCGFWEINEQDRTWRTQVTAKLPSFDPTQYHELTVYIRNRVATGYVDDTFCTAYIMPIYSEGYVGLVASNGTGTGGKFYFDEFRIYQLP